MSTLTEPERAVPGVKGNSPRFRAAREELPALNRLYLEERNAKLALQRRAAEIDLAQREATLIPRRRAKVQLGFLLTGLRQRLLSFAYALPPRLVDRTEHEIGQTIDAEIRAALRDIATWPEKMADAGWQEAIAPDLTPADANGESGISPKALGELDAAEKRETARQKTVRQDSEKRRKRK